MFKKYKQLIIGFLLGALLFSIVPVSATIQDYLLQKSSAKLMVDGKEFANKDLPVLNHKGYNYIPAATFREVCNTIGVSFEWVGAKNEIQIDTNKKQSVINTIEKSVEERKVSNVDNTYIVNNRVEKDGYELLVVDGVEYILVRSIWEKHSGKYNLDVASDSNIQNQAMMIVNRDTQEKILDISHERVYTFGNKTYFTYEYFKNTILPIIGVEGN